MRKEKWNHIEFKEKDKSSRMLLKKKKNKRSSRFIENTRKALIYL